MSIINGKTTPPLVGGGRGRGIILYDIPESSIDAFGDWVDIWSSRFGIFTLRLMVGYTWRMCQGF